MILSKLWERDIFLKTIYFMLFFLSCAFILFVIIDFSINSFYFVGPANVTFTTFSHYYFYQFLKYFNLFVSLALLLATIKVLVSMTIHHETVALYMAGISKKKLSYPFFIIGFLLTLLSYINAEFFSPHATQSILNFKSSILDMTKQEPNAINVILLKDSTKMIYLQEKDNILFDVFWINSFKNIWHIKYLKTDTKYPIGKYVDHFIKSDDGKLEKQESFPSYTFKQMVLKKENNDVDLKSLPLSTLIKKWYFQEFSSRQKKTDLLSQLNYKLALALTPLLIPLAAIPFCLRFSRNISIFSITSIALFMFILFFTTMDASLILAENQVLPSFFIIWLPMVLFFTFFGIVFKKRAV